MGTFRVKPILRRFVNAIIILVAISLLFFGFFHDIPEAMGLKPIIMAGW